MTASKLAPIHCGFRSDTSGYDRAESALNLNCVYFYKGGDMTTIERKA